ncbi:MAG TPA: hypothetical protein VF787_08270, partial [Thermoanaerobaculia bacterium]
MRIRTQLILAAFLLLVVPLAAIVGYSYTSSRKALEAAYRAEADRLTKQMDRRLAAIRADIEQRLTVVSSFPISDRNSTDVSSIVTVMGDAASLVDALEFQPVRVPQAPVQLAEGVADLDSDPDPDPDVDPEDEPETPQPAAPVAPVATLVAPPPAPPAPRHPIVIELPAIEVPRYVMSEAQQELITEVSSLGTRLSDVN